VKERLRELLAGAGSGPAARNLAREFLQATILAALQRAGAMVPLAFQGGTALRLLYSIRRHSEDLDFALERAGTGYDFRAYLEAIRADMRREGYAVDLARVSDQRAVHSAFVRFRACYDWASDTARGPVGQARGDARPPSGATPRPRWFAGTCCCGSSITIVPRSWREAARDPAAAVSQGP
jgi:hypothetical protein